MHITFAPRKMLQIDDARIIFRNFAGKKTLYNDEGNRNFALVIPDEEAAEALQNDKNEFGVGWNVKIRAPRVEGENPLMHLPVKVNYKNHRGPQIFLVSGTRRTELFEETVGILDDIEIDHVDLDIRPNDGEGRMGGYRTAYLYGMEVYQKTNRFEERWNDRYAE